MRLSQIESNKIRCALRSYYRARKNHAQKIDTRIMYTIVTVAYLLVICTFLSTLNLETQVSIAMGIPLIAIFIVRIYPKRADNRTCLNRESKRHLAEIERTNIPSRERHLLLGLFNKILERKRRKITLAIKNIQRKSPRIADLPFVRECKSNHHRIFS